MSETVYCDACRKPGRRKRGWLAPDGWLFLEAREDGAHDPEATAIIIWACSEACSVRMWQKARRSKPEDFCSPTLKS